ncbi:hypothetical protein GCM10009638_23230 [Luteococcus sanguinis]
MKYLLDLVGLGAAMVVLDVDPWVAGPWCLVDGMGAACVPGGSEVVLADLGQLRVADVAGIGGSSQMRV